MDQQIMETCKYYIEEELLDELKTYVDYVLHLNIQDYRLPIEYMYQQIYLHSCLKKKPQIAEWIQSLFSQIFNEVQQIALRQMFIYGKYLLSK